MNTQPSITEQVYMLATEANAAGYHFTATVLFTLAGVAGTEYEMLLATQARKIAEDARHAMNARKN